MESHQVLQRLADSLAAGTAEPVAAGIVEHIWLQVVEGTLETGERLPTARQLAIAMGVSPRTVERAYRQLEQRGVIAAQPGVGTFVALTPPPEEERARHRAFAALCRDAMQRARALGFDLDDLIDALADYRALERNSPEQERQP